jgi:hypothetical protein
MRAVQIMCESDVDVSAQESQHVVATLPDDDDVFQTLLTETTLVSDHFL